MDGFQEVVESYEPMIYQIIHSLNIYKNLDEFYQTGLIALWEARVRFDEDKGRFSSFAYTTIRGRILTELTRSKKIEEQNVNPKEEFWEMRLDETNKPPFELATLLSYCDGLTVKQKKWVILTFYFGMNTKEIATEERISVTAVKKWRNAAMEKLKENVHKLSIG